MRKVRSIQKAAFPAPDVATKVVPAPTEGWDAISPIAVMDPKRAPILINWVPRPGYLELRAGYTYYNILHTDAPVQTLMTWRGPTNQKFFAASGTKIFDVSTFAFPADAVTGLGSSRWQYVNFSPSNGANVIQCVNGVDALHQFDGTTWTTPSITGLPGGASTADIINIWAQKRRLWYVIQGTATVAFMPTDAISGAISGTLQLGQLWTKGGYLVAMGDWTIDGGNGPQDYAVFISSQGQATIYTGTDPSDSTKWTLQGVFDLAPPIGRRCMTKVGSDLAIITRQGVLPISQALPYDPSADRSVSITSRIQNAMAQATVQAGDHFGWQLIGYPTQQLAILNVPLAENSQQVQYVENVLIGAWCQFQGWNANCFEMFNDDLYFGDNDGNVLLAYEGGLDGTQPIAADMQCAFNYFDDPGRVKRATMVQPLLTAAGTITPFIEVDQDFQASNASSPIQILQGGALWDVSIWGGQTTDFAVSSANATQGATYTDGAETFVVLFTIAGGTTLVTTGSGTPVSSGTLTRTSGTGDATISFSSYSLSLFINTLWPQTSISVTNWLSATAIGHALAVRMKVNVASAEAGALGEFDLSAFDMASFDSGNTGTAPILQVNAFNMIMEFGGFI